MGQQPRPQLKMRQAAACLHANWQLPISAADVDPKSLPRESLAGKKQGISGNKRTEFFLDCPRLKYLDRSTGKYFSC